MQVKDDDSIPIPGNMKVLAVSPKYMITKNYTNNETTLMIYHRKKKKFEKGPTLKEDIKEAIWNKIDGKFLLLGEEQVFAFETKTRQVELLETIQQKDKMPFKTFAFDDTQGILFIAYDEWEPKSIEKWKKDSENRYTRIGECPINLHDKEFIGVIKVSRESTSSRVCLTIYNEIYEKWRIEIRDAETGICLKALETLYSDQNAEIQMIKPATNMKTINWIIYCTGDKRIITVDQKWQTKYWKYKEPVEQMINWGGDKLIICRKRAIDVQFFSYLKKK